MTNLSASHTPQEKILLTGATGMIGGHLLMRLLDRHYPVRATYRSERSLDKLRKLLAFYGREADMDRVEWVRADVTSIPDMEQALEGVEAVIHTAAVVSFAARDRQRMMDTNVKGTAQLVNLMLEGGTPYLLHVSSIAAIGGNGGKVDENTIWTAEVPRSYYAISKHLAEMEVWRGMQEGLRAGIINPSVVIGLPAGLEWTSGFGKYVRDLDRGRLHFTFPGTTGYVDVDDVTAVALKAFERRVHGERFIVSSENWSFDQMMRELARRLGVKAPRRRIGLRTLRFLAGLGNLGGQLTGRGAPYDLNAAYALYTDEQYDNSKARRFFDHHFMPVAQSLDKIVEQYRRSQSVNLR